MKRILAIMFAALLTAGTFAAAQETIEFWYGFSDAPRSGWIQDRIEEYNAQLEEQGLDYALEGTRQGSYRETLQAAVLAARQGQPPHLVQLFEVGSQLATDSGIFEPIGNLGGLDEEQYIEPVINYYTIDGAVNSIPFNSSSPILYANQQLMSEAGLDDEDLPETFGELLSACEAIEESPVTASCITFPLHSWFFEQWMAEQGALLVNNGNGRDARATEVLLDSEAAMTIGQFMADLAEGGYYSYTGTLEDWSGSEAIFANQESVFFITSTADAGNITRAAQENGFDVRTGLLPIPDGVERNGVVIGGASVWLTSGHPQEELEVARDFALYMTNAENMVSWHKLTGYYPVVDASVELLEQEGWFEENPNFAVAFEQLLDTIPNQATAGALLGSFLETRTIIEEALQRIYNGSSTVEQAMQRATREANARLEEYNANF
ncbi:MAG: ABC transporter substrate-binding protein [Trueperaceae bacterium]|nr:ABC transporter substrate-binding protein [Trueperaceae bacterium]